MWIFDGDVSEVGDAGKGPGKSSLFSLTSDLRLLIVSSRSAVILWVNSFSDMEAVASIMTSVKRGSVALAGPFQLCWQRHSSTHCAWWGVTAELSPR